MKKLLTISLLTLAMVLLIVSCSAENNTVEDELAVISFDASENATRSLTRTNSVFNSSELYWYYTAEKKDSTGLTTGQTVTNGVLTKTAVNSTTVDNTTTVNKGLKPVGPFSYGDWEFVLYGCTEANPEKVAYKSEVTKITINKATTALKIFVTAQQKGTGTLVFPLKSAMVKLGDAAGTAATLGTDVVERITFDRLDDSDTAKDSVKYEYSTVSTSDSSKRSISLSSGSYSVTFSYLKGVTSTTVEETTTYDDSAAYAVAEETIYVTIKDNQTTVIGGDITEYTGEVVPSVTSCISHTFGDWTNSTDLTSHYRECSVCHEKEYKDGIIVTPDNAQELINSVNTGKIYFTAGTYGDLTLTHGKKVSTARTHYGTQTDTDINSVQDGSTYDYIRSINDMELIGGDGVNIGSITCTIGQINAASATTKITDPIKSGTSEYFSLISIDGLLIEGMSFSGVVRFDVGVYAEKETVKNVTINNCKFQGTSEVNSSNTEKGQAMSFGTKFGSTFENIVITNNTVNTYFQGFYCENTKNVTVKGCTISKTTHNAVAIQSDQDLKFSGDIIIEGNTISDANNRAIRFNEGENATIIIENNTFSNAVDSDKQLLKTETLTSCTYAFHGNTYGGNAISDVSGSDTSWTLTITE